MAQLTPIPTLAPNPNPRDPDGLIAVVVLELPPVSLTIIEVCVGGGVELELSLLLLITVEDCVIRDFALELLTPLSIVLEVCVGEGLVIIADRLDDGSIIS